MNFLACLGLVTLLTQTPEVPQHLQAVGKIVGKAGTLNADSSYRINIARTDVKFLNKNGMDIPADLGLATYIAFSGTAERSLAVGDVAMLDHEIDGVVDALRAGNFEVVALHNHMSTEQPRLFFLHFQAVGEPGQLAKVFKTALTKLGVPAKMGSTEKPGKQVIDAAALEKILGVKPQTFPSGVLRFANPRKDVQVSIDDLKFLPGMGLGSWAAFHACECGKAMVMGDTCCLRSDLQNSISALRKAGIHITAIHNHITGGNREVSFMHYEGEGKPGDLAKGIAECWRGLGK